MTATLRQATTFVVAIGLLAGVTLYSLAFLSTFVF